MRAHFQPAVPARQADASASTPRGRWPLLLMQDARTHHTCASPCARSFAAAQKPATLEEAVEHLVALRLDAEKKVLAQEYAAKEVSHTGMTRVLGFLRPAVVRAAAPNVLGSWGFTRPSLPRGTCTCGRRRRRCGPRLPSLRRSRRRRRRRRALRPPRSEMLCPPSLARVALARTNEKAVSSRVRFRERVTAAGPRSPAAARPAACGRPALPPWPAPTQQQAKAQHGSARSPTSAPSRWFRRRALLSAPPRHTTEAPTPRARQAKERLTSAIHSGNFLSSNSLKSQVPRAGSRTNLLSSTVGSTCTRTVRVHACTMSAGGGVGGRRGAEAGSGSSGRVGVACLAQAASVSFQAP